MGMQGHMTIKGNKQGAIDGPSKIKGREKSFEVLSYNHEVTVPFESRTGMVSGKRVHHPVVLTIPISEAEPKLAKALTTAEHLTVEIKFFRPHPDGGASEQQFYTVKLENAKLTGMAPYMPNVAEKAPGGFGHLEQLSFIYDTITWGITGGGEHIDKWLEPA